MQKPAPHTGEPTPPSRPRVVEPAAGGDITVEVLTAAEAFARLAPEWNRLHEQAVAASVFNSWIFQYQWWQVYGGEQPLRVLVARERGATTGILPLYVHTFHCLGLRVRALRFVGTGADTCPDDLGPLLAPGREEAVALELAQAALALPDADLALLTDIDPRSAFPQTLERAAREAKLACLNEDSERIAFVELPSSWQAFVKQLSSDRRNRLKSARRKAAEAHALRFFVWEDAATLDDAVDRLAELHRRRWREAGGSDSFATPQYLEFHRRVMHSALARGWLRLYCLELDGKLAAVTYCYRFRRRVYLMQAGFDPAKAKVNPGRVLLGHALEHAIGEGNEIFDFLRGEHRYKDQLATGQRHTRSLRVFHRTAGALAYRLRCIWLPRWKARLARRAPPKFRT